jgi:MFS family permease
VARQTARGTASDRVAALLFAVSFGTNVSTPLLVVYRHRLGLSPTSVTSIFAVYAVGLLAALLVAGPASDRIGRRRVVLPFAVLAVLTSLLFIPAAHAAPLLYAARLLQGVVSGAVFSVGTAWLAESAYGVPPAVSARRASVALNSGFALGPLTAGLLGQWVRWPTVLPFLVHVVMCLVALVLAVQVPETVLEPRRGKMVQLRLPAGAAPAFWALLVPTAVMVFAFPSTAATVLPFLLDPATPTVAIAGLVAGLTLGTAALVAPLARPLHRRAAPIGLVAGAAGLLLAIGAARWHHWPVLLPVAVLMGTGSGLTMTSGLTLAEEIATEETRGALYALYYAVVYAGFGVPVIVTATAGARVTVPFALLTVVTLALAGWLRAAGRWAPYRVSDLSRDEPDGVPSRHELRARSRQA